MTTIFNDPADFADEALEGFVDLHSALVRAVPGGVVRRARPSTPKVAVLPGGGSGHYPAFAGIVGTGFGDGAVCGNIFTSPSAQQAYSVAKAAESGAGVVFTYGNYAGDVINFGMATERLRAEGILTENVIVTDDVASAPPEEIGKRRGIAGDFTVFKIMGAAAERGDDLQTVVRLGRKANDFTRTIGTAFSGCTFPGATEPLFSLPGGRMALGLGIHGEPGLHEETTPSAEALGAELVDRLLQEVPAGAGTRVAVILNGLGSTKQEELLVLWRTVARLLRASGHEIVLPEVGELVTSLNMGGVSLTLTWLDHELEELWAAPAETPAYRRGTVGIAPVGDGVSARDEQNTPRESATATTVYEADEASRAASVIALEALTVAESTLREAEQRLGDLDAIAGDGDHGRGMVRGVEAARSAAAAAVANGAGAGSALIAAGDAWADRAGGTSGVLWGAGLRAFGETLGDCGTPDDAVIVASVQAYSDRIADLGKATIGDKTMMDALLPFAAEFSAGVQAGASLLDAWSAAAATATSAAEQTASLSPKLGRARPLAEKSVGIPDPGATSMALVLTVIGRHAAARFASA